MRLLEDQFRKNRDIGDKLRRYKVDPLSNQTVLNNCLVYEDGRFRKSGTSYLSLSSTPRSVRSSRSIKTPSIKVSTSNIRFPYADRKRNNTSKDSSRSSIRSKVSKTDSKYSFKPGKPVTEFKAPRLSSNNRSNFNFPKPESSSKRTQRPINSGLTKISAGSSAGRTTAIRTHKTYTLNRNERLLGLAK